MTTTRLTLDQPTLPCGHDGLKATTCQTLDWLHHARCDECGALYAVTDDSRWHTPIPPPPFYVDVRPIEHSECLGPR